MNIFSFFSFPQKTLLTDNDFQLQDDEDESMSEDDTQEDNFDNGDLNWHQTTLPDLLVQAFPDGSIKAPNVVIVGQQSSGKTKLVISMIFSYLKNHITDEMGDILLNVFRTGKSLTTRRPITVKLINARRGDEQCSIKFTYQHINHFYGDDGLLDFLHSLNNYAGNEIFDIPLEISIVARGLPNMQFTDLPGIRSASLILTNTNPPRTLNQMVEEWIANPNNTVVVIESAPVYATGQADTSLIYPMLK
jgi:hypothetical protein